MTNQISILTAYFDQLSENQQSQFMMMKALYEDWNNKINVISRKDMDNFYERHVLHSLAIAKIYDFKAGATIVDIGTGGGFPSIPLAVLFPKVQIHAIDSIGKKIKVVSEISQALGLKNLTCEQVRAEDLKRKFDFVVSRAVSEIEIFYQQTKHLPRRAYLCLKGGDLTEEFANFALNAKFYDIKDFFDGEFFETKKVVYIPL
jgi:16S rRNA (guanine527-N7)-methyltransferase